MVEKKCSFKEMFCSSFLITERLLNQTVIYVLLYSNIYYLFFFASSYWKRKELSFILKLELKKLSLKKAKYDSYYV